MPMAGEAAKSRVLQLRPTTQQMEKQQPTNIAPTELLYTSGAFLVLEFRFELL